MSTQKPNVCSYFGKQLKLVGGEFEILHVKICLYKYYMNREVLSITRNLFGYLSEYPDAFEDFNSTLL